MKARSPFLFAITVLLVLIVHPSSTDAQLANMRIGYVNDEVGSGIPTQCCPAFKVQVTKGKITLATSGVHNIEEQQRNYEAVKDLTAVVDFCSFALMVATNRARVPYFVLNAAACDHWLRFTDNVFKLNLDSDVLPRTVRSLLAHYRVKQLVIATDFQREANTYFRFLQEEYQSVATIPTGATRDAIQAEMLRARQLFGTSSISVMVLTTSINLTLFTDILEEGLFSGLLRPGMKWFLPTYPQPIADFSLFIPSGATIFHLKEYIDGISDVQRTNASQLAGLVAAFLVHNNNSAVLTGNSRLQGLRRGSLETSSGTLRFHQTTGNVLNVRVNVSIIQDRKLTNDKYVWANDKLKLGNSRFTDHNDWKIAVIPNSVFYNKTSSSAVPTGFAVDLIQEFTKVSPQIIFTFVFPPSNPNITTDISGSWRALVDMLMQGKADVAFVPIARAVEWDHLVDFANPTFGEVGINMLMAKQNETEIQRILWYITAPFTINVWIACAVSFLLLTFVLWATDKISPNYGGKGNFNVLDSVFLVSAAFMMAKLDVKPRMMSVRIFNLLLWFATLIMMASYAGSLFQYILNKPPYIPVKDFDNALAYGGTYKWFWRNTMLSYQYFNQKARDEPQSVEAKMLAMANKSWPGIMLENDVKKIPAILKDPNMIAIGDSMTHLFTAMSNCKLQTHGTVRSPRSTSFPLRKNWNGRTLFDTSYVSLVKTMAIRQLKERYFDFNPCLQTSVGDSSSIRPMGIFDVMGIFLLLGAGLVLAIIICILELVVYKADLSCQRLTGGGLTFGKTYNMKVALLEPDGIWVEIAGERRNYFVPAQRLHPNQDREVSPADLGIQVGTKIKLSYHGNDPTTGERLFRRPQ